MCTFLKLSLRRTGALNPCDSKPWNCVLRRGRHSPIFHPPACECKRELLSSLPLLMAAICLWRLLPHWADYDISALLFRSSVYRQKNYPRVRLRKRVLLIFRLHLNHPLSTVHSLCRSAWRPAYRQDRFFALLILSIQPFLP